MSQPCSACRRLAVAWMGKPGRSVWGWSFLGRPTKKPQRDENGDFFGRVCFLGSMKTALLLKT